MAERRPLVTTTGSVRELPSVDTLPDSILPTTLTGKTLAGTTTFSGSASFTGLVQETEHSVTNLAVDCSAGNAFSLSFGLAVVGTSSLSVGSSSSATLTLPASLENDVMVVAIGCDGSLANVPSGWTSVGSTTGGSGSAFTRAIYKVMGATPDTTVGLTGLSTAASAVAMAIRGCNTSTPMDATATTATGTSGMPDPASITTVTNAALVLAIGFLDDDNVASSVTLPTSYGVLKAEQASTAGSTTMVASRLIQSAGAENPGAFGGTGTDDWGAITAAIRPSHNTTTLSFSNVPAGIYGCVLRIRYLGGTITWPAGIEWPSGSAPTLVSGKTYEFNLQTHDQGTIWKVLSATPGVLEREKLAANRTYYVRADGSDTNSGLTNTPEGAFLTLQAAWNRVATLDTDSYAVGITIGHSGKTFTSGLSAYPAPIGGAVAIDLGGSTISTTSATAIQVYGPTSVSISNGTLATTTGGDCISVNGAGGKLSIGTGITFGACAGNHIRCISGGYVTAGGAYSITGGAAAMHLNANLGGIMEFAGLTVTLTGTLSFWIFAYAGGNAAISCYASSYTGGTITGTRYTIDTGGNINTFGGGSSYFPGNSAGSGGTTTGGGFYA